MNKTVMNVMNVNMMMLVNRVCTRCYSSSYSPSLPSLLLLSSPTIKSTSTSLIQTSNLSVGKRLFCTSSTQTKTTTTTNDQPQQEATLLPSKIASNLFSISHKDILPMSEYTKIRNKQILPLRRTIKSTHQINIGPNASFTFLNYDLLWIQMHEMLFIEKGGEEQISGELEAYNPLIPQGNDFVGTLMFEIGDPEKRLVFLKKLGHVEERVYLSFLNHRILAVSANNDIERTTPDGKTSAVHFLRFPLNNSQVKEFSLLNETHSVLLGIEHEHYPHITKLNHELVKNLQSIVKTK